MGRFGMGTPYRWSHTHTEWKPSRSNSMAASRASAHVRLIWGRVTPKRTGCVIGFPYTTRSRLSRPALSSAGVTLVPDAGLARRVAQALPSVSQQLVDPILPPEPAGLAQRRAEAHVLPHLVDLPALADDGLQPLQVSIQRGGDHRVRPHELAQDEITLVLRVAERLRGPFDGRPPRR